MYYENKTFKKMTPLIMFLFQSAVHPSAVAFAEEPNGRVLMYGVVLVIINMYALVALYRSKNMCRQIRILVINLCFSDIVFGMSFIALGIVVFYPYECTVGAIILFSPLISVTATMVLVTLLSLDRFLANSLAFRYVDLKKKYIYFYFPTRYFTKYI